VCEAIETPARPWQWRASMLDNPIVRLLAHIHHNVDQLCEDLERDRPDLAASVRSQAEWIPRPAELLDIPTPPATSNVHRLGGLLYEALDVGLIDARQFDVLMVQRTRAEHALRARGRR
jgi:hypothetical protein